METHAHDLHKAPGHGWKHYFFEFFMLFLAVLLGFFAENMREQHAEKERAAKLAKSFYAELKADSAAIQTVNMNRLRRDSALTFLQKYFLDSSIADCSKEFTINFSCGFMTLSPHLFEPHDAILDQLKNSGSLRYFKSEELQKLIGNISETIASVKKRNEYESKYVDTHLGPYLIKHNDMGWYNKINPGAKLYLIDALRQYEKSKDVFPFHFAKPNEFDRTEAINIVGIYQLICRGASAKQYDDYEKMNKRIQEKLRQEYDLQ